MCWSYLKLLDCGCVCEGFSVHPDSPPPQKKENNPKEVNFYARSLEPRLSSSPARHR